MISGFICDFRDWDAYKLGMLGASIGMLRVLEIEGEDEFSRLRGRDVAITPGAEARAVGL